MGFSSSARILPFTNQPMSAGMSVTESSAAAAIAKVLVSASGRNNRPSWSSSVKTGRNDSVMIRRDMNSAGPTSRAAANTRSQCGRSGSCSTCLCRFSSITIAASIMMLENLHKHVEHEPDRPHWERVFTAAREVGPALFMSLLIITLSFLPVFTLEDQEGRLFRPLALTKTFAMAAAALLSVTLVPVLMGWFVKGKILAEAENPLNRWAIQLYRPVLQWALRARWLVLGGAAGVLLLTVLPLASLGSEFMPPLNEGSLMYMPNTLPALSLTTQRRLLHVEDSILMTFPEVASVWGKAGRANTATDWAPMSMVETVVNLKPESEWRRGMTQDRLIAEMDQRLRLTGAVNTWTMPIKNRTDMLSTGVRTTLAVKIFGPDLQVIQRIGQDIERALAPLPGTASVYAERSFGGRYLDIRPDADALARYGLTTGDAQQVISLALGGEEITTTVEGRERYPVQVRYALDFRDDPDEIARILVGHPDG